jgi:hypothetical protein
LEALSKLKSLSLAGRSAVTAAGLPFLGTFESLEALNLSHVRLGSGGASFLWQLPHLTCLELGHTQVRVLALLCGCFCQTLAWLRMDGLKTLLTPCGINQEGEFERPSDINPCCLQMTAAQFAGVEKLARLALLDARSTGFDDQCCHRLAKLTRVTSLK